MARIFFKKNSYEYNAWATQSYVCGIDEVGRGSLAGPLVTSAVILPTNCSYRLLKDSKEMTHAERVKADRWIRKHCLYSYGIVHHRLIDKHNIWQATLIAMRRAVINLFARINQIPCAILVDAMPLKLQGTPYADVPVHHFPFGEKKSSSIAAASIIAKVKRDHIMSNMDRLFPNYHWNSNKGYGTAHHKDAIKQHNPTIMHRVTYLDHITDHQVPHATEQQLSI